MVDVMDELPPERRQLLMKNVDDYIYNIVLPQLASLRSRTLGQLSGVVVPPPRITSRDHRPVWQPKTSNLARYVYCHNDLSQQNIVVDPKTLQVTSIIDWEHSGFFPTEFEKQFWKYRFHWLNTQEDQEAKDKDSDRLIAMLDEPGKVMRDYVWQKRGLMESIS